MLSIEELVKKHLDAWRKHALVSPELQIRAALTEQAQAYEQRIRELKETVAEYDRRIVAVGGVAINSVSREHHDAEVARLNGLYEQAVAGRQAFRERVRELEAQRVPEGMVIGDIAPAEHGAYLCMVQEKGATTAYPRVVWFGYYEYFVDETPTLSEGQTYNEDDAMVSGTGWHNEIEQFGGEYDFVTVTFNTNGDARIVNYSPTKLLPKPLPAAPAPKEGE